MFGSPRPYIREVIGYWITDALFERHSNALKRELFTRIILSGNLFGILNTELSLLLFGRDYPDTVSKHLVGNANQDLQLVVLERIKFQVSNWQLDKFNDITGKTLTKYEMVEVQDAIIKETTRFVSEHGFITNRFIKYNKFGQKYSPSYEALTSIIFAATLKDAKDRNILTLNKIKPMFSNEVLEAFFGTKQYIFTTFTSGKTNPNYIDIFNEPNDVNKLKARDFFREGIETIYKKIYEWHEEEFGSRDTNLKFDSNDPLAHQRLYYYQQAMHSIYKFVLSISEKKSWISPKGKIGSSREYFLDFPSPSVNGMNLILSYKEVGTPPLPTEVIANGYDYNYWNKQINYAFQKTFHLCRFRGFDPFFRPLQDSQTLDRHHFRIFAFRKMSSNLNDFVMTSQSFHKKDFEPLFKKLGARKAEAYVEALVETMKELDDLWERRGKIKQITEQDLINALKHNFGAEWRGVYEKILELNDNDLTDSLKKWNNRGIKIQNDGYSGFLDTEFNSVFTNQLKMIKRIQLVKVMGVLGSIQDFKLFEKMLAKILPDHFAKITRYL